MSEEELKKGCGKKMNYGDNVIIKCGEYVMSWDRIKYCSECKAKLEGYQKAKEDNLKMINEFVEKLKEEIRKRTYYKYPEIIDDCIDKLLIELKNKLEGKK